MELEARLEEALKALHDRDEEIKALTAQFEAPEPVISAALCFTQTQLEEALDVIVQKELEAVGGTPDLPGAAQNLWDLLSPLMAGSASSQPSAGSRAGPGGSRRVSTTNGGLSSKPPLHSGRTTKEMAGEVRRSAYARRIEQLKLQMASAQEEVASVTRFWQEAVDHNVRLQVCGRARHRACAAAECEGATRCGFSLQRVSYGIE